MNRELIEEANRQTEEFIERKRAEGIEVSVVNVPIPESLRADPK